MAAKVVLVDVNPKMIAAWRATFEENPEVEIFPGSMLAQRADAWVTPTNARASMDGGLDAAIKGHLGASIEKGVQSAIRREFGGLLDGQDEVGLDVAHHRRDAHDNTAPRLRTRSPHLGEGEVRRQGLEPRTRWLRASCSAN